jgi:plasmid maintenance system antidote protein VapI
VDRFHAGGFLSRFAYFCIVNLSDPRYRCIPPGVLLSRVLKKRGIRNSAFAQAVGIYAQSWHAMARGLRPIPMEPSLRMDRFLEYPVGTVARLQLEFEIWSATRPFQAVPPELQALRRSLFWDTTWEQLDWERHSDAIIRRVQEYGNPSEKDQVVAYYGQEKVEQALAADPRIPYAPRTRRAAS